MTTDDLTPRERILDMIARALDRAYDAGAARATADHFGDATGLLEEIESRVIGIAPENHLLFCSPRIPPDFLEMTPADEADIRGGV